MVCYGKQLGGARSTGYHGLYTYGHIYGANSGEETSRTREEKKTRDARQVMRTEGRRSYHEWELTRTRYYTGPRLPQLSAESKIRDQYHLTMYLWSRNFYYVRIMISTNYMQNEARTHAGA